MYRFVRHPIYLGYLITHVGFIVANPAPWNLFVLAFADVALLFRAVCEEKTLARDDAYRATWGACAGGSFRECSDARGREVVRWGGSGKACPPSEPDWRSVHLPKVQRSSRTREAYRNPPSRLAPVRPPSRPGAIRARREALDERMLSSAACTMPRWTPVPRP